MDEEPLLLIPGPVPVAPAVRAAMDAPMCSRRSAEFGAIYDEVREGLEYVFTRSTADGTPTTAGGRPLVLNGTATMAMEAAVANLAGATDEVVALTNGAFGDRFVRIAEHYATCTTVSVPWGDSLDLEEIGSAVDGADLVLMVQNETSTGLANPVAEVGALLDDSTRFVVDGVSSVGGVELRLDAWGVDVAITDPQKALAAPPGISAMYLSEAAIDDIDASGSPIYHDLADHLAAAAERRTPYTAASPQFRALAVALERVRREGMPARIRRHQGRAAAVRAGVEAMGLEPFPTPTGPTTYSNTLTAVALPRAVRDRSDDVFAAIEARGVQVGGGIGHLDGEVLRIGNMGDIDADDLERGVRVVGEALEAVGAAVDPAAGAEATREALADDR